MALTFTYYIVRLGHRPEHLQDEHSPSRELHGAGTAQDSRASLERREFGDKRREVSERRDTKEGRETTAIRSFILRW
jgi:hypothetical protein